MNQRVSKGTLIIKSLKTIQSRCGKTGKGGLRTRPEQDRPEKLPLGERARLSHDNTANRLLPAA